MVYWERKDDGKHLQDDRQVRRYRRMEMVTLGKTGITVNKNGFGALPIQRISTDDAVALARRAYEAGMTFFDTARFYTDSEEK